MKAPTPGKSLAEKRPDLVPLWSSKNDKTPFEVYPGTSTKKYYWLCPQGHEDYLMTPYNVVIGQRCRICGIEKRKDSRTYVRYNKSLGYLKPSLISIWSNKNNRDIFTVSPNSHKKYLWVCPIHGEYEASCAGKFRGNKCKKCTDLSLKNRQIHPPIGGSLGDLYPELVPEYSPKNPISPYEIYPGSSTPVLWECLICSRERVLPCYQRTGSKRGRGCPHCCNNQTSTAEESLREALIPYGALPESYIIGKWNVDIFFPEKKTVIEYDGAYYHSSESSLERDRRKSLELLAEGYKVVRVRTFSERFKLDSLDIGDKDFTEIFCEDGNIDYTIDNLVGIL